MRKTLILITAAVSAGSLAACKPFWQKDPPPAPTATVEAPTPATTPDPSKPTEQTASTEMAKTTPAEKTETATPAAK